MRIGIDLGGTKIEGVVLAPSGRIIARRRIPTPAGDYEGTVAALTDLVRTLESEADARGLSVGIAMPGSVSRRTGLVKNSNSVCLNGRAFQNDVEAVLGRPVQTANDANCFALSEAADGAGKGYRTVFGVIMGTGVGGGVVIDGRIVDGPNGVAGEWGHNPLPWPDPAEMSGAVPCYCGQIGCIETWISGPAIERLYAGATGSPAPVQEIVTAAGNSEACAQAALEALGHRTAKALATIVNVLDPDVIVLGGGVSNVSALYEMIPPILSRYAFSDGISTPVVRAAHGDSSGVRGAAWLWPEA